MIATFSEFLENIIVENLHPALQGIVTSSVIPFGQKHKEIVNTVKRLTDKGESTGIEGNMPKGSSRAYIKHADPIDTVIDNQPAKMRIGTKIAIRADLDRYHDAKPHGGLRLGQLQNSAENDDSYTNSRYRILTHDHHTGKFSSNDEHGIFPPLIDHDHNTHHWATVGHIDNITETKFKKLTKTETHPNGISHNDFTNTLSRAYDRDNGNYWNRSPEREKHLDHVETHPLVQKFLSHQMETATPPHDYEQIKNLGTFTHPVTGQEHIVARDHGFSHDVQKAYKDARQRKYRSS